MTTNYERIKNMNIDEMTKFLKNSAALILVKKTVSDYTNEDGVEQWLQAESEVKDANIQP